MSTASSPPSDTSATQPSESALAAVARLEAGMADLKVPEPMARAEGVLLKAGLVLPLVGLGLIIVAWWMTSGTLDVGEQVPMVMSGGLLGLALIMVGLGLFLRYSLTRLFRFWLARVMVEQQAQTQLVVDALARVEAAVRDQGSSSPRK